MRARALNDDFPLFTHRPPRLRAAGKLGNILGESLRRELQSFDHREIGENRLGELLDYETALDGERRRLDAVGALGR